MNLSAQTMLFGSAIALGLMPMNAAQAFNLDLNGTTYELSTITGTFDEVADQLATQPWWGDLDLATSAAEQVGLELSETRVRFSSVDVYNGGEHVEMYDDIYQLGSLFAVNLNPDYGFDAQQYAFQYSEYRYSYIPCVGGAYYGCWDDEENVITTNTQEMVIGYNSLFWGSRHLTFGLGSNTGRISDSRYYSDKPNPELTWTWAIATSLEDDPQPVPEPGMILSYGLLAGLGGYLRRRGS